MSVADQHSGTIEQPLAKFISLWALIGITSWTDFAAFLGALYSMLLIGEWMWKKALRPVCIARGWLKLPPAKDFR